MEENTHQKLSLATAASYIKLGDKHEDHLHVIIIDMTTIGSKGKIDVTKKKKKMKIETSKVS